MDLAAAGCDAPGEHGRQAARSRLRGAARAAS